MFENEIAVNEFQIWQFEKIAIDIPDDSLFQPSVGHGHPPVWILGHLAISGETGQRLLGGTVTHPEWLRTFGRGSSDKIAPDPELNKQSLSSILVENYSRFRALAASASLESMSRPHGNELFSKSPIKTVGQLVTLLLTNHFGFHLSQLSSCRRSAGQGPLF